MKSAMRPMLLWLQWIALASLGVAYVGELIYEMSLGAFPPEVLPLQVAMAIPILLGLALGIEVLEQEAQTGTMSRRVRRLLFWTPRVASLLFASFVSLFALDVFGAGYGFWETLLALLIHLIPVGVMLVGIAAAWRWPWVGAVFFTGWSAWYLAMFWGQFPLSVYVVMALLPFLLGLLFLLSWQYRGELRETT